MRRLRHALFVQSSPPGYRDTGYSITPVTVSPRLQWPVLQFRNGPHISRMMCLEWHLLTVTLFSRLKGVTVSGDVCRVTTNSIRPIRASFKHFTKSRNWRKKQNFQGAPSKRNLKAQYNFIISYLMPAASSVVELLNFASSGRGFSTSTCALLDIVERHFGKGQVLRWVYFGISSST